jgi:hypothetical protein
MDAGYLTAQEADAYLDMQIGSDSWFDTETIQALAGTVVTSLSADPSVAVVGTGTDFATDLAADDYFEADYQFAQILSVADATNLTLKEKLKILDSSPFYKLTAQQYARRKALYRKKLQALNTAYRQISLAVDLSSYTETPQAVKDAQCLLAMHLFQRPQNKHAENQANGIKRTRIGDMETEYAGRVSQFPLEVRDLLETYLVSSAPVQLYRAPMNRGPVEDILEDDLGIPFL